MNLKWFVDWHIEGLWLSSCITRDNSWVQTCSGNDDYFAVPPSWQQLWEALWFYRCKIWKPSSQNWWEMIDVFLDARHHVRLIIPQEGIDEPVTHLPLYITKYSLILKFIDHDIFCHLTFCWFQILGELWDIGIFCAKISGLYLN